jgi:SAM-dependent methyltransferase
MHPSAMRNAYRFFQTYGPSLRGAGSGRLDVVDIGSQDVNGSLRTVCPADFTYVGVDFAPGRNVDVVLDDPYSLPFADESVDVVLSNSCFEHAELFWLSFLEIMRVLKPDGLFYLAAPSNGVFHRYPVDCWRFYPDSGNALVAWARRNGFDPLLLETYTSAQDGDIWNDWVAVFVKQSGQAARYPRRIIDSFRDFTNGMVAGRRDVLNPTPLPEDMRRLRDALARR